MQQKFIDAHMAAAGVYVADQRLFDFFPADAASVTPLDLGFHVIPNLVGNMMAYSIEESLIDIGTPETYARVQEAYAKMKPSAER